jgi:hypothetical protein
LLTRIAFAIGIFALLILSVIPHMNWVYIRDPDNTLGEDLVARPRPRPTRAGDKAGDSPSRPADTSKTPEIDIPRGPVSFDYLTTVVSGLRWQLGFYAVGPVFLIVSALVAVLNLVVLSLFSSLKAEASDNLVAASGSAALAWGLTALIWLVGFLWKAFTLGEQRPTQHLGIYPGIGIAVGLAAAVVILGVFSYLILSRGRFASWFVSGSIGFLLGLLMLLFNVKPWSAPGLVE